MSTLHYAATCFPPCEYDHGRIVNKFVCMTIVLRLGNFVLINAASYINLGREQPHRDFAQPSACHGVNYA